MLGLLQLAVASPAIPSHCNGLSPCLAGDAAYA